MLECESFLYLMVLIIAIFRSKRCFSLFTQFRLLPVFLNSFKLAAFWQTGVTFFGKVRKHSNTVWVKQARRQFNIKLGAFTKKCKTDECGNLSLAKKRFEAGSRCRALRMRWPTTSWRTIASGWSRVCSICSIWYAACYTDSVPRKEQRPKISLSLPQSMFFPLWPLLSPCSTQQMFRACKTQWQLATLRRLPRLPWFH